jgi:hypothetical protein
MVAVSKDGITVRSPPQASSATKSATRGRVHTAHSLAEAAEQLAQQLRADYRR